MKVGILGSGIVGRTLGSAFLNEGYEVMMGTAHPEKEAVVNWLQSNPGASAGTFTECASYGDMLVLAVSGHAALKVLEECGAASLTNKVLIDTTNPIEPGPPDQGVMKFFTNINHSLLEQLQEAFPACRMVKAFNSVGSAFMYQPVFKEGRPSMFICGNDADALEHTRIILDTFGWDTEIMGSAKSARAIEPLCMLWCIPGFLRNEWTHAFKLLKA
ncbi:MAG TPA: NAD(P)-binding domain-containing protein [Chitinophagaceae bacterium]|nr:NAD(P)-binding domain-containing protein [Chitinophagaceae bacterium]